MKQNQPFDCRLEKLNRLISHLKSHALPIADELQKYALLISQSLTIAYTKRTFKIKKYYYNRTLKEVKKIMNLLLDQFDEEIIPPFRLHIIYEDLKVLQAGLLDVIELLNKADELSGK